MHSVGFQYSNGTIKGSDKAALDVVLCPLLSSLGVAS